MRDFRPCVKGILARLRLVRGEVVLSSLLSVVEAAAALAFVWYCKRVVDIATGVLDADLSRNILVLVLIMALQVVSRIAARYYSGYVVIVTKNKLRSRIYDKVLRSSWRGQEKFHSADMTNRMEEDIRVMTEFICTILPESVVTVLQLVAAVVMLFNFSSSLALILIWIMPVAVVGARLFFKRVRRLTNEIRTLDGQIQGHIQETLQHRVIVKTLGSVEDSEAQLDSLQGEEKSKTVKRLNYGAYSRGFMQVGYAAGYLAAFVWGVLGLKDGSVTYGLMVAFIQMVGQVQRPVANLAGYVPYFIHSLSSEERLEDLEELEMEPPVEDIYLAGPVGVRLDSLCFRYDNRDSRVLEKIDFDFEAGKMTAITGPTGIGKSTLSQLLLALLKPESGSVELYDSEGRCVPASEATRCNFMYVPQGNSLLSGSIRSNLLLACPDASEERLREVLHLCAADFVFDLPKGLDTECSEIGRGLSEGQAQRIAIARALLHRGSVLILDEATSALDSRTEMQVLTSLRESFGGIKTIICITHRDAALRLADANLHFGA